MTTVSSPPGPKAPPLIGNLPSFTADPLAFLSKLVREHGDISRFTLGPKRFTLANHPDLVREILVTQSHKLRKGRALERAKRFLGEGLLTSEGAMHKRQRVLLQPAFHKARIEGYAQTMVQCAEASSAQFQPGETIDMAAAMHHLTLAIVGRTLFGAEVEGQAEAIGRALEATVTSVNGLRLALPAWLDDLPTPRNRRLNHARAVLDDTIFRLIQERRADGTDRGDLLSMLLASRDAEGDGLGMSDVQVRDEAMTLFLAGHETTANALAWTWVLLARHPEVEARLTEELQRVLGDRPPTFADLPALTYTRMVLSESMRLYPPVWILGRRVVTPLELGPYTIAADDLVFVSQWTMHRDARYYPNPETFDPLRWTPDAIASRPKFCYFPFGAGPRLCIGEQFAWMEGVLLLAAIARKWRPRLVNPEAEIPMQPVITLRPRNGIPMVLEPR